MKIFVCEFVTGGGLYREPLPASLAGEGGLMLQALLRDLSDIPGVSLLTSRDARLPVLPLPIETVAVAADDDVWQLWENCIRQADAVWPIAPESGGVLERLSRLALHHGKRLLGSAPDAVAIAASKLATLDVLSQAGLDVVPTYRPHAMPAHDHGPWVAKPDDGIGCEDSRCFADADSLRAWLACNDRMQTHIVQPYLAGEAASLSALFWHGQALLLSCNRQRVVLENGIFTYHGSVLNGMQQHRDAFSRVAAVVAGVLPGLSGYAGIDVLVDGGSITVLEVNPRITTSYVGLRQAIGCNPAGLVLDLLYNGAFQAPPAIACNVVEVSLNE